MTLACCRRAPCLSPAAHTHTWRSFRSPPMVFSPHRPSLSWSIRHHLTFVYSPPLSQPSEPLQNSVTSWRGDTYFLCLVTAFPPHTLYIGAGSLAEPHQYNVSEPHIDMFVTCPSACVLLPIILSCFFLIVYMYASIWKWLFSSIMS